MNLVEILEYIANIEEIDLEIVISDYSFGVYDEFIDELQKSYRQYNGE